MSVAGNTGAKLTIAESDPKADPTTFIIYGPAKFNAKNATMADFARFRREASSIGRYRIRRDSPGDTPSDCYGGLKFR